MPRVPELPGGAHRQRPGFKSLGGQQSHQSNWKKSVFEVYQDATVPWEWTPILGGIATGRGSTTSDALRPAGGGRARPYVPAFKIGSGDMTWTEIQRGRTQGQPVILATRGPRPWTRCSGPWHAVRQSADRPDAVQHQLHRQPREPPPHPPPGAPDLHPGVSGRRAGALGPYSGPCDRAGRRRPRGAAGEKHFTDDTARTGPDHPFSMTPATWREMVARTRELEAALGGAAKEVAATKGRRW